MPHRRNAFRPVALGRNVEHFGDIMQTRLPIPDKSKEFLAE